MTPKNRAETVLTTVSCRLGWNNNSKTYCGHIILKNPSAKVLVSNQQVFKTNMNTKRSKKMEEKSKEEGYKFIIHLFILFYYILIMFGDILLKILI